MPGSVVTPVPPLDTTTGIVNPSELAVCVRPVPIVKSDEVAKAVGVAVLPVPFASTVLAPIVGNMERVRPFAPMVLHVSVPIELTVVAQLLAPHEPEPPNALKTPDVESTKPLASAVVIVPVFDTPKSVVVAD